MEGGGEGDDPRSQRLFQDPARRLWGAKGTGELKDDEFLKTMCGDAVVGSSARGAGGGRSGSCRLQGAKVVTFTSNS